MYCRVVFLIFIGQILLTAAWALGPRLELIRAGDGPVTVRLFGENGARYQLQASMDQRNWSPISDAVAAGGLIDFADPQGARRNYRFYRAVRLDPAVPPAQSLLVNAGDDQSIEISGPARLTGAVFDGPARNPAGIAVEWTQVSGPGVVIFENARSPSTAATFSEPGTYVLYLTASDGDRRANDEIQITIRPAAPDNQAPQVNAGPDQAVNLPGRVSLTGSIIDDGLPAPDTVAVLWTKVSGPGDVAFENPAAASTAASFSVPGTYVLYLTASDGDRNANDEVVVVANPAPSIVLPIEVLGADGTTRETQVRLPPGAGDTSPIRLWMQIHGMTYPDKASVQVNHSAWFSLNNSTVLIAEPARSYGGIGGGFTTLKMSLELPPGTVGPGENTVRFRFNFSEGRSSGFRVLGFNFLNAAGEKLLGPELFLEDDPKSWRPPHDTPEAIAQGATLWRTAGLRGSARSGGANWRAKCMDCHAHDGRDLKYFNYSNFSITERAKFHGLTQHQGELIASYIRSLNLPSPGRPWNPPYQPGPGLDSKPLAEWAAGAGIDWVLDRDADSLPHIFPNGINQEAVATTATLNAREIPVALQLPDWNHWLPSIHPLDSWGDAFIDNLLFTRYNGEGGGPLFDPANNNVRSQMRASLEEGHANLAAREDHIGYWQTDRYTFIQARRFNQDDPRWTPEHARKIYATALWQLVKMWELMQEFNLEGQGARIFGASSEARTWFDGVAFMVSPNMLHFPRDKTGINHDNPSPIMHSYFSTAWYHLQLILNNSNRKRLGTWPIDWPYVYGFLKDVHLDSGAPNAMQTVLWMIKGMQTADDGKGPDRYSDSGWSPHQVADVNRLVQPGYESRWIEIDAPTRQAIMQALVGNWFAKTRQFSALDYYQAGIAAPSYIPTGFFDGSFADRVMFMIPRFRGAGVNGPLLNQIAQWAQTVWPKGNWSSLIQ